MNAIAGTAQRTIAFDRALERRGLAGFPLLVTAAALTVLMIDGIDLQLLALVAPVIIEEWGISRATFGPALAGALIGMTLSALFGGWVGDRIGRLRALVAFTLLFGVATVLAAFTTQVWTMTALRVIGGIGFGAASPNAIALASEWAPPGRRGQITSLLSIGTPAGGMLGASLVLLFLPGFGWTGTFVICGLGSCLFGLVLWLLLRESPTFLLGRRSYDAANAAARPVLEEDEVLELPEQQGATGSARANSVETTRLFDRRLLRLNLGTGIAFFFVALVAYALLAWTTVIFASIGLPLESGVSAVFAFNLFSVGAAILTGFAVRRFGSRATLLFACSALAASVLLLWLVLAGIGDQPPSGTATTLAIVLVGCGGGSAGSAIAAIYAMMAEGYPQSCRGLGLGFGLTLGRGGGIVLSLTGGLVLDMAAGEPGPFFVILAVSAVLASTGALVSDRHAPPMRRAFVNGHDSQ